MIKGIDLEEIIINRVREDPSEKNIRLALMLVDGAQAHADKLRQKLIDVLEEVKNTPRKPNGKRPLSVQPEGI